MCSCDVGYVPVRIVEYVDRYYPGIVACELVDTNGRCHRIVEKVPIVSDADIDWNTPLPQMGSLRCKVLTRYRDRTGREIVRVTSISPEDVESTEGLTEFEVLATELSE